MSITFAFLVKLIFLICTTQVSRMTRLFLLVTVLFELLFFQQHVLFVCILIMWWCHVRSIFVLKSHVALTPPCLCWFPAFCVHTWFPFVAIGLWVIKPNVPFSLCQIVPVITCAFPAFSKCAIYCQPVFLTFCLILVLTLLDSVFWILLPWTLFWLLDFWPLPACWLRDCLFPLDCCPRTLLKLWTLSCVVC